ncbi:MAG: hypothetical protein IJU23_15190 [Proteobacteria bacterium]|nr:hypothetical protein [Pseudomonadota bacterium]
MDQEKQNNLDLETRLSSGFDDFQFDSLWNDAVHSDVEKKGPAIAESSKSSLDWGDLESDAELWSGLEAASSGAGNGSKKSPKGEFEDFLDMFATEGQSSNSDRLGSFSSLGDLSIGSLSSGSEKDSTADLVDVSDKFSSDSDVKTSKETETSGADVKSDAKAEESKSDEKAEESKSDEKAEESKSNEKAEESKSDEKAEESKSDEKTEEVKSDEKAEEAKSDEKAEESKADEKAEESKADEKAEESKSDEKVEESKSDEKSEESKSDEKSEESKSDEKSEESKSDEKSEESKSDEKSEESKSDEKSEELARVAAAAYEMTERACKGDVMPENEVVVMEHELKPDTIYSDEECEPIPEPVNTANRKLILLCAVLISVLIGFGLFVVCDYFFFSEKVDSMPGYHQDYVFQDDIVNYTSIASSSNGKFVAMCSDYRGIVKADMQTVFEFWPSLTGCRNLIVSDDGTNVYYIDHANGLYHVDMLHDSGINVAKIADLADMEGSLFDVRDGDVYYIARLSDSMKRVVRHVNLGNGSSKDVELPEDAMLCDGFSASAYAYLSNGSIYVVKNGQTEAASLEDPKLGCTQRPSQFGCASDGEGNWAVLCSSSIRQGKGKIADAPHQMMDDVAIRSGAKHWQLLRNANGTDYISTDFRHHIDTRNKLASSKFSRELSNEFAAAYGNNEEPLIALSAGQPVSINNEGHVSLLTRPAPIWNKKVYSTAFYANGDKMIVFAEEETGLSSSLITWTKTTPGLERAIPGIVDGLNVSWHGNYGFVTFNMEGAPKLEWIDFNHDFKILGLIKDIANPVEDAEWSADEKYVILRYAGGTSELFKLVETQGEPEMLYAEGEGKLFPGEITRRLESVREFPAEVGISFAQKSSEEQLLWYLEDGVLRLLRLSDGAKSVVFKALEGEIEQIRAKHVLAHPAADYLILWGDEGMMSLNLKKRGAPNVAEVGPVAWVVPDRQGEKLATSAGVYDLETGSMHPWPNEINLTRPLAWVGSNHFLMTEDGTNLIELVGNSQMKVHHMPGKNTLRLIGANSGFHPSTDIISVIRDKAISLERLKPNGKTKTEVVLAGSNGHWCAIDADKRPWIHPTSRTQNNMCYSTKSAAEGMDKPGRSVDPALMAQYEITKTSLPAYTPSEIHFVDDVHLTIHTVPDNATLGFASVSGELPKELVFADGVKTAPLDIKMKAVDDRIIIAVTQEGYVLRVVPFTPNTANVALRVPLLPEAAADLKVAYKDADGEAVSDVSESFDIELKSFVQARRDEVKACLKKEHADKLILDVNDGGDIVLPNDTSAELTACLAPVLTYIKEQCGAGALPEVTDYSGLRMTIDNP